jgi:uncharacterized protein (TIGR02266 family)
MHHPERTRRGRRRHPRLALEAPIRLSTLDPETDPWTGRPFFRACEERTANLSSGGVLVPTREPLAPGRRVLIEMTLPDGGPFEAIARVAWTRQHEADVFGLGFEFLGSEPDHRARLERFLSARAPAGPAA